jgi:hypothetical protein
VVPCLGDVVNFETTVSIWTDQDRLNVRSIISGGTEYTKGNTDLPDYQFGLIEPLVYLDTPATDCLFLDSTSACICRNSCPTDVDEERVIDQLEREAIERQAQEEEDARNAIIRKEFQGTLMPSLLGTTSEDLAAFLETNSETLKAAIVAALADVWGIHRDNVTITTLEMDGEGINLEVAGHVVAPASLFTSPGSPLATNGGTITVDIDASSGAELSAFLAALKRVIAEEVHNKLVNSLADRLADACSTAACQALLDPLTKLANTYEMPKALLDSICPDNTCGTAEEIMTMLNNADMHPLSKQGTALAADALVAIKEAIAAGLAGADLSALPSEVLDVLDVAGNLNDAGNNNLPVADWYNSPRDFVVGAQRPENDLRMLTNTMNIQPLKDALTAGMAGLGMMVRAKDMDVALALEEDRRRATGDPSHLEVDFTYEAYCLVDSTADCMFSESDAFYTVVRNELNRIVNLFGIVTHECFDLSTGWSESCLVTYGNKWLKDNNSNKERLTAHLNELLECTYLGRGQDGECYEESDEADTLVANTVSATTLPASEESSSASMLPIIAGAAAGVVVLAVIIIVVMVRRRKQGGSGKKADDRTVVAFENPMYDDPSQQAAQPDYESAGDHVHEEGLYDEPAFSNLDKSNPVYQSTEGIDAGGDAGYLEDGAAEEGGYLDVAPEDE